MKTGLSHRPFSPAEEPGCYVSYSLATVASLLPRENRHGPLGASLLHRKNRGLDLLVPSSRYAGPLFPRCCLGKTHMWAIWVPRRTARRLCGVPAASLLPRENVHVGNSVTLVHRLSFIRGRCGITGRLSGVLVASLLPKDNPHVAYSGAPPGRLRADPGGSGPVLGVFFIQWIIQRMRRETLLHALTQQACRDLTSLPTTEIICRRPS